MKKDYPFKISIFEAMRLISVLEVGVKSEKVHISNLLGRVLFKDIIASENIPPFDRSAFDGYAFRSEDTKNASAENPVTLKIMEEIRAGFSSDIELKQGQAVKILTGAPIPKTADAVINFEETEYTKENVTLFAHYEPHRNIIPAGEDVKAGQTVAVKGCKIDPPLIGLMASLGISEAEVGVRPTVTICNFGDELLDINESLRPGKIRNSNLYTLTAFLNNEGIKVDSLGTSVDDVSNIKSIIEKGLSTSDMVISTGGVSVGDYDLTKTALEEMGAEVVFWKMDIKPGASILVTMLDGKMILGLSGSPAAAVIGLRLIGIPYLKRLEGYSEVFPEKIKARLHQSFDKESPRLRMVNGYLKIIDGQAFIIQTGGQGNSVLNSMCGCNLIGMVPAKSSPLEAGTEIEAFSFN